MSYFVMRNAGGETIEGVHEAAVKDHERLGYKVIGPYVFPEPKPEPEDLSSTVLPQVDGNVDEVAELVDVDVPSAVSVETAEESAFPDPERMAALDRFTRTLASARKKPEGATAKLFEQLGVVIVDPPGDAEPWPPHVLMAQTIDALAKMTDETRRNVALVALFGKSGSYVNEFLSDRKQALAGEQ